MNSESWGIPLNGSIVAPVWRSMKRAIVTLHEKHNIQTFKYEIKEQALKNTSRMKPRYLTRLFLC